MAVRLAFTPALAIALLLTAAVATRAQAAPIQFVGITGNVTLTLDIEDAPGSGNFVRAADPIVIGIDGVETTLDPIAGSVVSMTLTTAGPGALSLNPGSADYAAGVRQVVVESAQFQGTNGLLVPVNPPTEHFFLLDDAIGSTLQVDSIFSAYAAGGIPILVNQPLSFVPDNASGTVNGEIAQGGLITVDEITLAQFTSPVSGAQVVLKGDVVFSAETLTPGTNPIPEPTSAVLLGAGALLVGYSLRRQLS